MNGGDKRKSQCYPTRQGAPRNMPLTRTGSILFGNSPPTETRRMGGDGTSGYGRYANLTRGYVYVAALRRLPRWGAAVRAIKKAAFLRP